jgi:hypothetical protein
MRWKAHSPSATARALSATNARSPPRLDGSASSVTLIPDHDRAVARCMLPLSRGGTRGSLNQPRGLALGPKRVWPPRLGFQKENGFGCYA